VRASAGICGAERLLSSGEQIGVAKKAISAHERQSPAVHITCDVDYYLPQSMRIAALEASPGISVPATEKTRLIFERARRLTARCHCPQPSNSLTGTFTSSPADDRLEHGQ
jgi:hypothetical protein